MSPQIARGGRTEVHPLTRQSTAWQALTRIGYALHGHQWLRKTARISGQNPGTLVKWHNGKVASFDRAHPVFETLVEHLRKKAAELARLADEVERWTR